MSKGPTDELVMASLGRGERPILRENCGKLPTALKTGVQSLTFWSTQQSLMVDTMRGC